MIIKGKGMCNNCPHVELKLSLTNKIWLFCKYYNNWSMRSARNCKGWFKKDSELIKD